MTRSKSGLPTNKTLFETETSTTIAKKAVESILTNWSDVVNTGAIEQIVKDAWSDPVNTGPIDQIVKDIESFELDYYQADLAFLCTESLLRDRILNDAVVSDRTERIVQRYSDYLSGVAQRYFQDRIRSDTRNDHVGDVLVEMERLLDDEYISPYFRNAMETVREECEKTIERQRKRAKIRDDLKMFDEPKADPTPEVLEVEELQKKIRDLEAEVKAKQKRIDEMLKGDALARGLTVRRLMYFLDREMPIFKNAATNAARGELAYMLTGLGGITNDGKRGEKIRQNYSTYSRLITKEDTEWLEDWKAKLEKVPRSKGGTL